MSAKGTDAMGMIKRLRLPAALLAVAALGGCISFGPKVPETLFSLTPVRAPQAGATASGAVGNAIAVVEFETPQRLAVTRIPVQIDDANVAYLKDASWVEKPSRLFRRLLAETLRARTGQIVVEGSDAEIASGSQISGRLLDFGYDVRTASVVIRADATRDLGQGNITTRRFESIVPVGEATAALVSPALNQAANEVAGQIADWVSQ